MHATNLARKVEALTGRAEAVREDTAEVPDPVDWIRDNQSVEPDPWQCDMLHDPSKRITMTCGRQVGKTTAVAWKASHHARFTPRAKVVLLSRTERQSKLLMRNVRKTLHSAGTRLIRDTTFELELPGDRLVVAFPGSASNIRGEDAVTLLIIDESSFVLDELWYAVEPMVSVSGGQIILLSSAFITDGFFYKIVTGDNEQWSHYKVTAYDCPRHDPDELDAKRDELPERVFRAEYLAEFVDIEDAAFTSEQIEAAFTDDVDGLLEDEEVLSDEIEPLVVR